MSTVPRDAIHPHYYADLVIVGTHLNGQSAGETRSTIHLANRSGETDVHAVVEQINLIETDDGFAAQALVANVGNVAFSLSVRTDLLNREGRLVAASSLSGDPSLLLPLGKRTYSGEIDLEGRTDGLYSLRIVASVESGENATLERVLLIERGTNTDGSLAPVVLTILDPDSVALPEEQMPQVQGAEGRDDAQ